jgi:hypothetical protein
MVAMELASVGEGTKFDMTATSKPPKKRLDFLRPGLVIIVIDWSLSGRLRTSSGARDSAGRTTPREEFGMAKMV